MCDIAISRTSRSDSKLLNVNEISHEINSTMIVYLIRILTKKTFKENHNIMALSQGYVATTGMLALLISAVTLIPMEICRQCERRGIVAI